MRLFKNKTSLNKTKPDIPSDDDILFYSTTNF